MAAAAAVTVAAWWVWAARGGWGLGAFATGLTLLGAALLAGVGPVFGRAAKWVWLGALAPLLGPPALKVALVALLAGHLLGGAAPLPGLHAPAAAAAVGQLVPRQSDFWGAAPAAQPHTRGPPYTYRRVTRSAPCPVCGRDSECYTRTHRTTGHSESVCTRTPSDRPIHDAIKSIAWVHPLHNDNSTDVHPTRLLAAVPGGLAARRDPDHLDRVYRRLLGILPLSPANRESLRARGITDAEIETGMYRSGPVRDRGTLARRLREDLGDDALRGVPGFYVDAGRYGDYWSLRAASGLLVPVSDEQGRIVGMQVRRAGDGPGPRYIWWSSKDMRGGASPGAPLGWFGPAGLATLWVTEGPIKAAIAASRLGARVVAVPGVGAWRSAGLVERVRAAGHVEVIIAYDADARANVQVAREAHGLCEAMVTAGVRVSFAVWDPGQGKGIDDLFVGGGKPKIVSPRTWEERLDPEVRRKAIGRANRVLPVPVTMMPAPEPLQRVYTTAQARREMPGVIRRALRAPRGADPRLSILQATTGTGKTTALRTVLEESPMPARPTPLGMKSGPR